jgi:DNA-binding HxlR family transcriptional regulator
MARTYDQYCPVAASLDHVGDRWTLLIVRDLVWYGPQRFTDFASHNTGIPTALLTERLRALESAGFVTRTDGAYAINDPDGSLRSLIDGLARFGMTLLVVNDPTFEALRYLAKRASTVHATKLAAADPVRFTVAVGETTFGVTIDAGAVDISDPIDDVPVVSTTAPEFARMVSSATHPSAMAISHDREAVESGLRFLSPAA